MEEEYLSESSDISDEDTSDGYSFDPMNDVEDLWASDTAEFFDSLGQPPEEYQRRFRNVLIANRPQYCYSPCEIQTSVSETCGLYYAYYNDLMPRYPTAAGFTLNHSYFIEDWGVSGDGFLQISRFVKRLDPRLLNYKNIVIPSRIADIHTHNLKEKLGYTRVYLKSHDMVVHHYRTCPTVAYWKDCLNFPKYKDLKMNHIRPEMEARVLRVLKELGLH
ncbi:unnamed protein product [Mytilus coruscus]|uniref:Uncharacterized protein n=1 Tax=Mytilus coruscus TaxID=42192 RepID=A0A6J8CP62_MYTCO|nr:unnamed protein product [Mytilus coruscus]